MKELNTTREEREAYVSGRERYPLFNDKELSEDCNNLEDELARVREELEELKTEKNADSEEWHLKELRKEVGE